MAREDFASQDPHRKIGSKKRRACGVTGSSRGRVCQGTTQEQGGSGERQRGECSAAVPAGGRAVRSPQYREGGKEVERSRGVVGDLSQRQEGDHRGGCDQRRACRGIERCESGGIFSDAHGVEVCNSRGPALAPVVLWAQTRQTLCGKAREPGGNGGCRTGLRRTARRIHEGIVSGRARVVKRFSSASSLPWFPFLWESDTFLPSGA